MPQTTHVRLSSGIPDVVRRCFRRVACEPDLPCDIEQHAQEAFGRLTYWQMDGNFVVECLPPGRILLSGAGEGSAAVLAAIEFQGLDKEIVALVDRRAADIREKSGYRVLRAAEAALLPFDYALVCHPMHQASMTQDLLDAGVPVNRIVVLPELDAFREFQESVLIEKVAPRMLSKIRNRVPQVEHVILHASRDIWSVIADQELAEVFPPEKTIRLYTGHPAQLDVSDIYASFDIRRSLVLLESLVRSLAPQHIYVRGSAHFQAQGLGVALRRAFPDTFLIIEVYDYTCMFEDEILQGWKYTPEAIELNRCAEAFLGRHADFVIDKTPGDRWQRLVSELFGAPRRHYFPLISPRSSPAATPAIAVRKSEPHSPSVRLLCAGTFPEFHRFHPGVGFADCVFQDIVTPIELLSRERDFRIDIFNSGHELGSMVCEALFSGYRSYFNPDRVRYHPCVPFAELVAAMADYHYGILLFSPTSMVIDFPLQESLPNRFMGYVAGGLPLIVNKELHYCASLVEAFDAGLTVDAHEIGDLPRRIREADSALHRTGAIRLQAFMADHNRSALTTLREAIEHQP